jgi:hypothetical protein
MMKQHFFLQELEKEPLWTHAILTVPQESAAALKQTLSQKAIQGKFLQICDITPETSHNLDLPPPASPRSASRSAIKTEPANEQSTGVHPSDAEPDHAAAGATPDQCKTPGVDQPAKIEEMKFSAVDETLDSKGASTQNINDRDAVDKPSEADVDAELEPTPFTAQVQ